MRCGGSSAGMATRTRAVVALCQIGFGVVGLHRLWAVCDVGNAASVGVLTSGGFIQEGLLRHDRWDGDGWRDSLLFGRLDSD